MVWVAIYQAMGIRFSSTVPFTYVVLSAASLALYLWKGNFPLFRFIQTSLFLFVPFIMQWSIGSYVSSSGVMLWALLAPVGVMIFQGPRESMPWFFAYIVLTALSGFFDYYLTEGVEAGVTMQSIAVFFALNFAAMSTIVYLLISYFVRQRDKLAEQINEQHRAAEGRAGEVRAAAAQHPARPDRAAPEAAAQHHRRRLRRRDRDVRRHHQFHAARRRRCRRA